MFLRPFRLEVVCHYKHQAAFDRFSTGRVLSHTAPGTPPKTVTISEGGVIGASVTSAVQQTPNKIAISPLKSPNKVKKEKKMILLYHYMYGY